MNIDRKPEIVDTRYTIGDNIKIVNKDTTMVGEIVNIEDNIITVKDTETEKDVEIDKNDREKYTIQLK